MHIWKWTKTATWLVSINFGEKKSILVHFKNLQMCTLEPKVTFWCISNTWKWTPSFAWISVISLWPVGYLYWIWWNSATCHSWKTKFWFLFIFQLIDYKNCRVLDFLDNWKTRDLNGCILILCCIWYQTGLTSTPSFYLLVCQLLLAPIRIMFISFIPRDYSSSKRYRSKRVFKQKSFVWKSAANKIAGFDLREP